jgi:hypothetical protein
MSSLSRRGSVRASRCKRPGGGIEPFALMGLQLGVFEQQLLAAVTQHAGPIAALSRAGAHEQQHPHRMLLGAVDASHGRSTSSCSPLVSA